ncbi:MAG: hypothetical protein ACFFCI_25150, partial [Promethearchaeota archaeon]
ADNKSGKVSEDHQNEALKTSEWNPDYNYTIIDNYPYSWIEINETGTNITNTFMRFGSQNLDDGSTGISFSGQGWNFTFYGTEYDTVNVSTNGFICFSGQGTLWENTARTIPQDGTVRGEHIDTAFLFHTDINLGRGAGWGFGGGSVFYEFKGTAPNRYLVIEYFQVKNWTNALPGLIGDFEAIFYENGTIKFQYKLVRELMWDQYSAPVVGLDHGDLINFSNYTNNWTKTFTGDVKELAVYFELNLNYTMDTNADYNWYEIIRDGTHMTWLSNEDDGAENITFIGQGWNFTFYDTEYSYINVSSNGWMSFTNLGDTDEWIDDIPSNIPENQDCVSLLCTDIDLDEGGDVYYYFGGSSPNRYLIIEYYRAHEGFTSDLIGDFEVIFYESGNIKFQYKLVTDIAYDLTPIIGLDHGDLSYYNSYTPTLPLNSKAIKFIFNASAEDLVDFTATIPPPAAAAAAPGDDDDDDDGEEAIPGFDLYLILLSSLLALIAIVKKFRKHKK